MAKVLIVDDDSHFRGILERIILRSYTYSVKTASTEDEAWEELSKTPYDLVLLDLYIDGRKSWDTLKRARNLPSPPAVIMVSCESTEENAQYAKALGAADFVPKPIDFAQLKVSVDAALECMEESRPSRRSGDAAKKIAGVEGMRVLLVPGEMSDQRGIGILLEKAGFQAIEEGNARSALAIVLNEPVGAVLVDFQVNRERAAENCRMIREGVAGPHRLPMIAVTDASPETILLSLKSGADDYVTIPFDSRVLSGKVQAHVRLRGEYDLRLEEAVSLCVKDALTGLYNHDYFKARLSEEFHRSQRYKRNLTLAILGLENLEKVKADFSAPAGNWILSETSRAIRSAIRSSDVVARSAEAEFALILPEATSERILSKAGMVRTQVQERVSVLDDRRTGVTCSMGLASMKFLPPGGTRPDQVKSAEDLLGMASMALTQARGSVSGRVAVFVG